MLPIIPKPAISPRQKSLAVGIAGFVDLLELFVLPTAGFGIFSPLQDIVDIFAALALIAICGFKWQFIAAFMAELVPGLTLFPTWTAIALTLPTAREPAPGQPAAPHPHQRVNVQARVVPPVQTPPVQPTR